MEKTKTLITIIKSLEEIYSFLLMTLQLIVSVMISLVKKKITQLYQANYLTKKIVSQSNYIQKIY